MNRGVASVVRRRAATTSVAAAALIRTPDVAPVRARRRAPLFKPPFVLSLDLGVKKLAYCLLNTSESLLSNSKCNVHWHTRTRACVAAGRAQA